MHPNTAYVFIIIVGAVFLSMLAWGDRDSRHDKAMVQKACIESGGTITYDWHQNVHCDGVKKVDK